MQAPKEKLNLAGRHLWVSEEEKGKGMGEEERRRCRGRCQMDTALLDRKGCTGPGQGCLNGCGNSGRAETSEQRDRDGDQKTVIKVPRAGENGGGVGDGNAECGHGSAKVPSKAAVPSLLCSELTRGGRPGGPAKNRMNRVPLGILGGRGFPSPGVPK